MSLEAQLQTATAAYQKLQAELSKTVTSRQTLDAQLSENQAVKKEFDSIPKPSSSSSSPAPTSADYRVFKALGPCLVKQDTEEARANVERRLEFLGKEVKRLDGRIASAQSTSDAKRLELVHIQAQIQQQQQTAAQQSPSHPGGASPGGGKAGPGAVAVGA